MSHNEAWRSFEHIILCLEQRCVDWYHCWSWWRHQMETFSALLAICAGNPPVPGDFPAQRPVTRSFDIFFDLRLNKRFSKQSWGWWFETLPSHYDVTVMWFHCSTMIQTPVGQLPLTAYYFCWDWPSSSSPLCHRASAVECSAVVMKWVIRGHGLVITELILGLRPTNERRRYFVTTSLIGWVQS